VSAAEVLPILREALSQRPEWREFSPRQLALLLWMRSYLEAPPEELDVWGGFATNTRTSRDVVVADRRGRAA
jgi:hypothetical protein